MGIKIVIPANCIDEIDHGQSNHHIEEYMWSMLVVMEQYISNHYRSLSQEIRRIKLRWQNALLVESLLKLGADTKYILYGRSALRN